MVHILPMPEWVFFQYSHSSNSAKTVRLIGNSKFPIGANERLSDSICQPWDRLSSVSLSLAPKTPGTDSSNPVTFAYYIL